MSPKSVRSLARDFEQHPFWKKIMLPAMEASIEAAKEQLVYLEDTREIRALQNGIKMTMAWMSFPKRKDQEMRDEQEFEKDRSQENEGNETEDPPEK